ncbi:MAG: HDIG domain-containing protein [archaeon]|nr:HDIG domain-containing protein [archaeon]
MKTITEKNALELLKKQFRQYRPGWEKDIVCHAILVRNLSSFIGEKLIDNGYKVDMKFLRTACILHDIGYATAKEKIKHGVCGARCLRSLDLEKYANAAERHIGIGISAKDSFNLGLGAKDYVPKTIEEIILSYADNLDFFDKRTRIHTIRGSDAVCERFGKELGKEYKRKTEKFNKKIEDMVGARGMAEFRKFVKDYNKKLKSGSELKL